jgi:response regulator RpfG family c-di-GMP phosphodiesterase
MTVQDEDELEFASEETSPGTSKQPSVRWKVLIVDDEDEVHRLTHWVLTDFKFEGRTLEFLDARSRAEAQEILREHGDVALILLDVVMEEDDAGLRLVRFIRDDIGNTQVRIILRTGQPGQAPEQEVVATYDINDYKSKTELTAQKLFTTVMAALRAYRDIITIDTNRRGLETILHASSSLFEKRSMTQFVSGALLQIQSLLHCEGGALLCSPELEVREGPEDFRIIAASGAYSDHVGMRALQTLPPPVGEAIVDAHLQQKSVYRTDHCAIFFKTRKYRSIVVYTSDNMALSEMDKELMELFCSKIAIGFDNITLFEELAEAQKATIYALARMAEYKDQETGEHLQRVEDLSRKLILHLQSANIFPELEDEQLVTYFPLATILHDVGKVGVPSDIILLPRKLSPPERGIMEQHTRIGRDILEEASRMVQGRSYLNIAAEIAGGHHEKYDGTGYPEGLRGDDIPLTARIVAVADVFDALTSTRPYKRSWPVEEAVGYIREQSGRHFDPRVVDALLAVIETVERNVRSA